MEVWVVNDVYDHFCKNPLDAIHIYKHRDEDALMAIVMKYIDQCPGKYYDSDYRTCWKLQDFVNVLKSWIKIYTKE
jgi:hypothetical protein